MFDQKSDRADLVQLDEKRNGGQVGIGQGKQRGVGIEQDSCKHRKVRPRRLPEPRNLRNEVGNEGPVEAVVKVEEGRSRTGNPYICQPCIAVTEASAQGRTANEIGLDQSADMFDLPA